MFTYDAIMNIFLTGDLQALSSENCIIIQHFSFVYPQLDWCDIWCVIDKIELKFEPNMGETDDKSQKYS